MQGGDYQRATSGRRADRHICWHYARGYCRLGDQCGFAHPVPWPPQPRNHYPYERHEVRAPPQKHPTPFTVSDLEAVLQHRYAAEPAQAAHQDELSASPDDDAGSEPTLIDGEDFGNGLDGEDAFELRVPSEPPSPPGSPPPDYPQDASDSGSVVELPPATTPAASHMLEKTASAASLMQVQVPNIMGPAVVVAPMHTGMMPSMVMGYNAVPQMQASMPVCMVPVCMVPRAV
eukprot:TRINITY_DN25255_c0_g1_i1.p1 TRINITY_DN25255_c0_g1~~TRINITY_DN25255_c0_g1_i1.p1  ORF type:complete len:232 (+),score=44.54 TRINITY_DN25255_c0_g1_i1:115-810(+)